MAVPVCLRGPELVFFMYGVYVGTMYAVTPPYVLQKVCENYYVENEKSYDPANCYGSLNATMKAVVEAQTSTYQVILQLAAAIPATFSVILIATWSDEHGRKTPLLFAIAFTVFTAFVWILSSSVDLLSIHWILLAQLLGGICGHTVLIGLCFAMITDITKEPSILIIRMGIASCSLSLGVLCATSISTAIDGPYAYKFLIGSCIQAVAFFYAVLLVNETYVSECEDRQLSAKQTLQQVFNVQRFKDYGSVLSRFREDSKRTFLLTTLVVFFVLFICDQGMPSLQFLFVRLPPLGFTDSKYAEMLTITVATASVSYVVLPILARRFGFSDISMILFGLLISTCRMVLFAISKAEYMIYISAALSGMAVIYFPAFRSYLSHLVEEHETARVFATVALMEQIGPLFSTLIFNYAYAAVVAIYPGFVFLMSAAIQFCLLCTMTWVYWSQKKLTTQRQCLLSESRPTYT